ncbi:MAG: DNA polymerase III subunit gamma/tau [Bacteroidales bacterium]|jgi:DNA polymerase-3 subunit gamma/tau|nr:DNA polymerase III subunit gamma/tau [Bacteroidales bacterium]
MENFIVSARKYRPANFKSVVGQASITTTLKNAIKNNHLAQAYLFCGPRGVGKTTCARIFAKTINCENLDENVEPCNKCESCESFSQNRSYNIHELDAASNNSVEDIRNLIEQVRIPPQVGKYSIYIIDEVHMLSSQAFNAFLKTLEEPPPHAIFILATTEKHKIIPTILSRCQIFDFNRIRVDDTVDYIEFIAKEESITYEIDALNIIAQKADGAMRDALSIFDQVVSFSGKNITYEGVIENLNVLDYDYYFKITDAFLNNNISETLLIFNEITEKGFDAHHFINGLSEHLRNVLVCKDEVTLQLLEVGANIRERYKTQTTICTQDFLFSALEITNKCDTTYRLSKNKRLHVELSLISLCNIISEKKNSDQLDYEKKTIEIKEENKVEEKSTTEKIDVSLEEKNIEKEYAKPQIINKSNSFSSFSIKQNLGQTSKPDVLEEPATELKVELQENPNNDFKETDLIEKWHAFSNKMGDKPRIFNTLTSKDPKLGENNIVSFLIDNNLQEEKINEIRNELLAYLKSELKNSSVDLKLVISDKEEENNKLYTSEDKFKHMLSKNDDLNNLKQEFNLDLE